MNKVSVILVNYNGGKYNIECIESILKSTKDNFTIEIIVVDNGSCDKSINEIRKKYNEDVKIIELNDNLGFAVANNIGIKYSIENNTDFILLLNNDTIIEKDMINILYNEAIKNKDSIVVPKIMYYDHKDTIWSAGGEVDWNKGITLHYGMDEKDDKGQYDTIKEISFGTGCCMFIPIDVINKVGFLEEKYFLYYEDTDYCIRIKKLGYRILYIPKAKMYHKVTASSGGVESSSYIYYLNRNRLYFNKKYNNKKRYLVYIVFAYLYKIIKWMLKGKFELIKALNLAISDYKKGTIGKVNLIIKG